MPQNRGTSASVFCTTVECSWPQECGENYKGHVGLGLMLCPSKSVGASFFKKILAVCN